MNRASADRCRQLRLAHQVRIDCPSGAASFRNRPHDQRLAALDVAGGEHARHVRHPAGITCHRIALGHRHAKVGQQPILTGAGEAHRQQYQICLDFELASGHFREVHAAVATRRFDLHRLQRLHLTVVADEAIPGTLNVGHALPTVAQGLIFIGAVRVGPATLVSMMAAAAIGAWLGAGIVARLPRRAIQLGMGAALSVAAVLFTLMNLEQLPSGGAALELEGAKLVAAVSINFVLGALMTLGIGLYAP